MGLQQRQALMGVSEVQALIYKARLLLLKMGSPKKTGIQMPLNVSNELAKIIGTAKGEQVSRPQVLKKYNLQDPEQKQWFTPDKTMQPIFGKEKIKCFSMSKYLKEHLTKPEQLLTNISYCITNFIAFDIS